MLRTRQVVIVVFLLAVIGVTGCGKFFGGGSSGGTDRGVGSLAVTMTWPERSKDSRLIPDAAESVKVTVTHETEGGVGEALIVRQQGQQQVTTRFDDIPVGTVTVEAAAYPGADGTGTIQATASLQASILRNGTTEASITMGSTIVAVEITPDPAEVVLGGQVELTATARDQAGQAVLVAPGNTQWSVIQGSSNASVDQNGVVTGLSEGQAVVRATESESQVSGQGVVEVVGVEWRTVVVDSQEHTGGQGTSLAFGAEGPAISYLFLQPTNLDLRFAWHDGSEWNTSDVESDDDVGSYSSLAYMQDGHPAISYYDQTNEDLKFAWMDASGWNTTTLVSSGEVGKFTSLAFGPDPDGFGAIAYYDATTKCVRLLEQGASGWQAVLIELVGDWSAEWHSSTSVAFGPDGYPALSYRHAVQEALRFAWKDAGGWHIETVDQGASLGVRSSLAFGLDGRPAISYFDAGDYTLMVARRDGGGWQTEEVDVEGGLFCSLAFRPDGYPAVAYLAGDNDLRYAWQDADGWHKTTVDAQGWVGQWCSLAFSADGTPGISYEDWTNKVLKYAWLEGGG